MGEEKKQSFISNLFKSIKDFDYYKQIYTEKISKSFIYFIILIIVYSIITTIGIVYNMNKSINQTADFINTEINNLNYSNGILTINNNEYKSFFNNYIIIDTSKENNNEYENKANIVIGKQYCTLKLENNIFKFKYNDYFYEDINKEDIMQILTNKNTQFYIIFSILALLITIITLAFSTVMDILIIALIGSIMAKIIGNNEFKFSNMFKIAVHAITLPIILSCIYYILNTFTGFYIKYFSIMYTSITTIYVVTAILLITADKSKSNDSI
ncbi:MAG: DUF1189 family protein [Clostridia bacterium]|nr:DUF1189 family protein [Clostridia bacterium]